MKKRFAAFLPTPIGPLEISGTDTFITSVNFVFDAEEDSKNLPPLLVQCKKELEEYFAGKRREFTVKTKPDGTVFQKKVWDELKTIRFGNTKTYGAIAKQLGDGDATRAVGHANGKNPVAIIIPCHRIIGENGKLTGYAGGMWRKQWLLDHEGNISGKNPTLF